MADELLHIAGYVSYSRENSAIVAQTPLKFDTLLNSVNLPFGSIVRDCVSDADKWKSLGADGFDRLILYTTLHLQKEHGRSPTSAELHHVVNQHSQEKLLRLKDHFMRTPHGKYKAVALHDEFITALETFNKLD